MVVKAKNIETVEKIVSACADFQNHSKHVKVDKKHCTEMYRSLIATGSCALFGLVDDGVIVGGLGCIICPDFHSGEMTATELFWFVRPENRGRGKELLESFEAWGKENNCTRLIMVYMEDSMPEALTKLYMRRGYKPLERHFIKEI